MARPGPVLILRSGELFLVQSGTMAVLVAPGRPPSPPTPLGSLLAHVHVEDPWEPVAPADGLPAAVLAAASDSPPAPPGDQ